MSVDIGYGIDLIYPVERYKTFNGKEFETEDEAKEYLKDLSEKLMGVLDEILMHTVDEDQKRKVQKMPFLIKRENQIDIIKNMIKDDGSALKELYFFVHNSL